MSQREFVVGHIEVLGAPAPRLVDFHTVPDDCEDTADIADPHEKARDVASEDRGGCRAARRGHDVACAARSRR